MSLFFPVTLSAYQNSGAYVSGVWTDTKGDVFTFKGSIQPYSQRDYSSNPNGRKDVGMVKIYTNQELVISVEGSDKNGDIIIWKGKLWEVISVDDYSSTIINHKRYHAQYKGVAE